MGSCIATLLFINHVPSLKLSSRPSKYLFFVKNGLFCFRSKWCDQVYAENQKQKFVQLMKNSF